MPDNDNWFTVGDLKKALRSLPNEMKVIQYHDETGWALPIEGMGLEVENGESLFHEDTSKKVPAGTYLVLTTYPLDD